MVKADKNQIVQDQAQKLLDLLGIGGQVEVQDDSENEAVAVNITTDETGILIGRHGETIAAFQLLLNQIVQKETGEWQRILVDTGDYRTKQEDVLKNMALSAAQKVKESGNPYSLYDLTPGQRRYVHTVLAEDPQLLTESEGEGRERHLVIKPRG